MQLATVIGHATATIKHPSLNGWRMLIVQPLGVRRDASGDPVIAVDRFGAGADETYVGDPKSPVRWFVVGIVDETRSK
jgi:ethanolamine utilization protein EutN